MKFEQLNIMAPVMKALQNEGFTSPTPIQEQAIPVILEGRDMVGIAQTGTGKTAAFAVPLLQLLVQQQRQQPRGYGRRAIKALILTPTRELAAQIGENLATYGKYTAIKHTVIFGGVSQVSQTGALTAGVDILVATPGRLLDLMAQKYVRLDQVNKFVVDEADRMLDMGFFRDMQKIIAQLPAKRQTLLFSATMPREIDKLAEDILRTPVRVEVNPASPTVDAIEQTVYFVERQNKTAMLIQLLNTGAVDSALVFTQTKHGADKVVRALARASIKAQAIHGNKSQRARLVALNDFKSKRTRVLIATDIASRGIDVRELSHVINYDLPNVPETYVHRIGRTGRAGLGGSAVSFCDREERKYLKDIQTLMAKKISVGRELPIG